jgi:hypothetical protein
MKNEEKQDFDDRVKLAKRKAIEDNIARQGVGTNETRRAGQSGG